MPVSNVVGTDPAARTPTLVNDEDTKLLGSVVDDAERAPVIRESLPCAAVLAVVP
jgi:hypothetical protein